MNPNPFLALPHKELLSADSCMAAWYYGKIIRRVPTLRELTAKLYICVCIGGVRKRKKSADRYNTVLSVVLIRISRGT